MDDEHEACSCCELELRVLECGVAVMSVGDRHVQLRPAQIQRLSQMLGEALGVMLRCDGGPRAGEVVH